MSLAIATKNLLYNFLLLRSLKINFFKKFTSFNYVLFIIIQVTHSLQLKEVKSHGIHKLHKVIHSIVVHMSRLESIQLHVR